MIEIMVIVKDEKTKLRDFHFTDVIADAETLTADELAEVHASTKTAVTAALYRLQNKAGIVRDFHPNGATQ